MVLTKNNVMALMTVLAGVGAANLLTAQFGFDLVQMASMGNETAVTVIHALTGIGGVGALVEGIQQFDLDY